MGQRISLVGRLLVVVTTVDHCDKTSDIFSRHSGVETSSLLKQQLSTQPDWCPLGAQIFPEYFLLSLHFLLNQNLTNVQQLSEHSMNVSQLFQHLDVLIPGPVAGAIEHSGQRSYYPGKPAFLHGHSSMTADFQLMKANHPKVIFWHVAN